MLQVKGSSETGKYLVYTRTEHHQETFLSFYSWQVCCKYTSNLRCKQHAPPHHTLTYPERGSVRRRAIRPTDESDKSEVLVTGIVI